MWKPLHPLYNLYRRWFGAFVLDDPRIRHQEAPYTFQFPSAREIRAIRVGDSIKLIFRSQPPSLKHDAERMWVTVTEVSDRGFVGELDNLPFDMPQMKPGMKIQFQSHHIISVRMHDHPEDEDPPRRHYYDRCLVDSDVITGELPVYYLYREAPDMDEEGDQYPDSGWRIRGDYRGISDEDLHSRKAQYVAVGVVLNADDSWLHLLDLPVGSAFLRNFETGLYEPCEQDTTDDET